MAARAEGVGSALTVVLGVFHGPEAYSILGVPPDEGWIMACCVSFGYPQGRWASPPVARARGLVPQPWGTPVGFDVPEPLWSADTSP